LQKNWVLQTLASLELQESNSCRKLTGRTPLSDSTGGGLIPSDFEIRLKNLMLAEWPLFAGSPLLTNIFSKSMTATKIAVSDDTASDGIVVNENSSLTDDAELTGFERRHNWW